MRSIALPPAAGVATAAHWITASTVANVYLFGLTEEALEEGIPGDVDAIILDEPGKTITIQYSGLKMSSADELYHAIYTPVEGTFLVEMPFLASNRQVARFELNPELIKQPSLLSSAMWIAKLHVHAS